MLDVMLLITLAGEFDIYEAEQVRRQFPELLGSLPKGVVLLDLTGITFLDAAGARSILWMGHQALAGGHEWGIITGDNRWIHRVFALLGWTEALPLYSDWSSATLALRPQPG